MLSVKASEFFFGFILGFMLYTDHCLFCQCLPRTNLVQTDLNVRLQSWPFPTVNAHITPL